MSKRIYDNTKRAERSRETRERILVATVERMAHGEEDIPAAEIAKAAGVSLRTVYQHFPDKAARISAINDWIDTQVDVHPVLPKSFEDIPGWAERLVDYAFDNETLMRAQMTTGLSKEVRTYRKKVHAVALRKRLRERISRRALIEDTAALLLSVVRVDAFFDMRDVYGLSASKVRSNVRRMVELFLIGLVDRTEERGA